MRRKNFVLALVMVFVIAFSMCVTACAGDKSAAGIEITSESLTDGKWDEEIGGMGRGDNLSPQLSWSPVEGAACYAVGMLDPDASNWLHMFTVVEDGTSLELGAIAAYWTIGDGTGYQGPNPPPGDTHNYEVYVVALKSADVSIPISVGMQAHGNDLVSVLDTTNSGEKDNIITYSMISGTYG